jgi:FAD:protein FMN transferase
MTLFTRQRTLSISINLSSSIDHSSEVASDFFGFSVRRAIGRAIDTTTCLICLCCAVFVAFLSNIAHADGKQLTRYEYKQYHMGVDVRIVVYAPTQEKAESACAAAFERFAELDTCMSDYRSDSELMRLCDRAGGPPVPVSRDLFIPLQRSQEVAARGDGAFDVTCSPLVRLWRKARKTHVLPQPAEIEHALTLVGWRKMRLDAAHLTVQLLVPGMQLDLGGIGKGYGDDCAQEVLKKHGITRALVEAGGDIVVSDPPPGKKGWKIQVDNAGTGAAPPTLLFANCAVSTSGDTEQFVEIGGKRYSHIINPHTGQALTDRIAVTIVARDGLTSDSLSTAVSVLGVERGQALTRTYRGAKAYIAHDRE